MSLNILFFFWTLPLTKFDLSLNFVLKVGLWLFVGMYRGIFTGKIIKSSDITKHGLAGSVIKVLTWYLVAVLLGGCCGHPLCYQGIG